MAPTDWNGSTIVAPTFGMAVELNISRHPLFIETGAYYTNRYIYDNSNVSLLIPALLSYHIKLKKEWSIQPFYGPFIAYGFNQSINQKLMVGYVAELDSANPSFI